MAYFRQGLIISKKIYDKVGNFSPKCLPILSISYDHAGHTLPSRQFRGTSKKPTEAIHDEQDYYGLNESETDLKDFKVYGVDKLLEDVDPVYFEDAARQRFGPKEPLVSKVKFGTIRFDKENKPVDLENLKVKDGGNEIKTEEKRKRSKRSHLSKTEPTAYSEDSRSAKESDAFKQDGDIEAFIDGQYFGPEAKVSYTRKENHSQNMYGSIRDIGEGQIHGNTQNALDNMQSLSYIDEHYFNSDAIQNDRKIITRNTEKPVRDKKNDRDNYGSSYIEEQYFQDEKSKVDTKDVTVHLFSENQPEPESVQSYIENQYFGGNISNIADGLMNPLDIGIKESNDSTVTSKGSANSLQAKNEHDLKRVEKKSVQHARYWHLEKTDPGNEIRKYKEKQILTDTEENNFTHASDTFSSNPNLQTSDEQEIIFNNMEGKQKQKKKSEDFGKEQSAFDLSRKIRTNLEMDNKSNVYGKMNPNKVDSMGFRILSGQVPHLDRVPSIDVVKLLRQNVLYDDNDIVAINKPYGLPSHGGPGVQNSVGHFLNDIIPNTRLNLIHRLDKETTGVMLLGRTPTISDKLHDCFRKRVVKKKYLVITKNCPEQPEGIIDIPMAEGSVGGKMRMVLRPHNSPELNEIMDKRQAGTEAITAYRVLDRKNGCALLECIPETGLKHQIRVHLAFGLNCPVLGDHKYAHINKLAPMRLNPTVLDLLNIRQSKVRHLAMHLHARSLLIPEFINGMNFFVSAPLPVHFVRNLKDLKLKLPPRV